MTYSRKIKYDPDKVIQIEQNSNKEPIYELNRWKKDKKETFKLAMDGDENACIFIIEALVKHIEGLEQYRNITKNYFTDDFIDASVDKSSDIEGEKLSSWIKSELYEGKLPKEYLWFLHEKKLALALLGYKDGFGSKINSPYYRDTSFDYVRLVLYFTQCYTPKLSIKDAFAKIADKFSVSVDTVKAEYYKSNYREILNERPYLQIADELEANEVLEYGISSRSLPYHLIFQLIHCTGRNLNS